MPDAGPGARPPVPVRLLRGDQAGSWPQDMCHLEAMAADGDTVHLEVTYVGGCEEHRFELVAHEWGIHGESFEVELLVAHDARGDACKAIVHERLRFSLQPLFAACRDELAAAGDAVTLRIDGRSLVYHPAG